MYWDILMWMLKITFLCRLEFPPQDGGSCNPVRKKLRLKIEFAISGKKLLQPSSIRLKRELLWWMLEVSIKMPFCSSKCFANVPIVKINNKPKQYIMCLVDLQILKSLLKTEVVGRSGIIILPAIFHLPFLVNRNGDYITYLVKTFVKL